MKISKHKISLSFFKHLYILTIGGIALTVGLTFWFLYYNAYKTLGYQQQIIILQGDISLTKIDTELYGQIQEKHTVKQKQREDTTELKRNIFLPNNQKTTPEEVE